MGGNERSKSQASSSMNCETELQLLQLQNFTSVCNVLLFAAETVSAGAYSRLRICSGQESGTRTVESWV